MKKLYASTVMKNEHTTGTIKYYQILDEKYGIETYNNYHITSSSKGEAKLTDEQTNIIKEIISKYF